MFSYETGEDMTRVAKTQTKPAQPEWATRGERAIPHIDAPRLTTLDTDLARQITSVATDMGAT